MAWCNGEDGCVSGCDLRQHRGARQENRVAGATGAQRANRRRLRGNRRGAGAAWQILRPYPEYRGRERWTDRVFYRREDGVALPLSTVWKDRVPWIVRPGTGLLQLCAMRDRKSTRLNSSHL